MQIRTWKIRRAPSGALAAILIALGFLAVAFPGRVGAAESKAASDIGAELAHDDGTAEAGRGFGVAGSGFAVRFSLPADGVLLLRALIYVEGLHGEPGDIEVHVWDADRQDLTAPVRVAAAAEGWLDVDLSSRGLMLSDDAFVGYLQTSEVDYPWVGLDTTTSSDRSYALPDWTNVLPDGACVMIRIVVADASAPLAGTSELAYDDGSSDAGRGFAVAGAGYAVRFTPPSGGARLLQARLYLTGLQGEPAPIEVHVWDRDGKDLAAPLRALPAAAGWLEVDLSGLALTLGDDFLIGYLQTDAGSYPWIGLDTTTQGERSYALPDAATFLPMDEGSLMIRVVLGTPA